MHNSTTTTKKYTHYKLRSLTQTQTALKKVACKAQERWPSNRIWPLKHCTSSRTPTTRTALSCRPCPPCRPSICCLAHCSGHARPLLLTYMHSHQARRYNRRRWRHGGCGRANTPGHSPPPSLLRVLASIGVRHTSGNLTKHVLHPRLHSPARNFARHQPPKGFASRP